LITVGGLVVFNLIVSLFGAGITVLSGISGMSGAINSFLGAIITVFAIFLFQSFGTVTIMYTIYSILALPLSLMGTPGFFPKIFLGFSIGIIIDSVFWLIKKGNSILVAFIIGFLSQYLTGLGIYLTAMFFNVPGVDGLKKFLFGPLAFGFILISGFGCLGLLLYRKVLKTNIVKRIQMK
jgi:hypothetical protein